MIQLRKFDQGDYDNLISWIDSEEMLIRIAGRQMSFPVTKEQLDISQSDAKRNAFSIIDSETGKSIGHCELYLLENSAKIDRVIIGDLSMKGKGLCYPLMKLLLDYGFNILKQSAIELNVFDWNTAAISCYEKAGLKKNNDKTMEFETNGEKWIAFNMSIDRKTYEQNKMTSATQGVL
ncbi:GNAT family N-acetyltransferase [Terrimonas pollutisoli]|uniref:GNAT family N-acetyltransferase n=1 Tax=Terrimonas pollutisoli TaxID=3034147 RepID=UPI0023ED8F8D|nr:GNAT family protein [Terrimonas sp. H1YJ31]